MEVTIESIKQSKDYQKLLDIITPKVKNVVELNHLGRFESTMQEFHIRLGSFNPIRFNSAMIKQVQERFMNLNAVTNQFTFEYVDVSDWDEEPGERTWPARIYFKVIPKIFV